MLSAQPLNIKINISYNIKCLAYNQITSSRDLMEINSFPTVNSCVIFVTGIYTSSCVRWSVLLAPAGITHDSPDM